MSTKRLTLRYWVEEEVRYVEEHWQRESVVELAMHLKRPVSSVEAKVLRLRRGLRHARQAPVWTDEKLAYLREHYKSKSRVQLAAGLATSVVAIKAALAVYGIHKNAYVPRPDLLSEAQKAYIAGLLDADGSVLVIKGHHKVYGTYLRPFLCVATMAEHVAPETVFSWLVGVGFVPAKRLVRRGKNRSVTDLQLRRQQEVIVLLEAIMPYLIAKQERARVLVAFCKAPTQEQRWVLFRQLSAMIPVSAQRRHGAREVHYNKELVG